MGRIARHRAGRRLFVGALAVGALALAACVPLKPSPEPEPPVELPELCIPDQVGGDPRALAEPAPAPEPGCTPICLPGQEPPPAERALAEPAPEEPKCVPICPIGGDPAPELNAQRVQCIRIPIPCLPGQDPRTEGCVNFCLPGDELPPEAAIQSDEPRCTPLCDVIPPGFPGLCERGGTPDEK
jgi:hypothetical protein